MPLRKKTHRPVYIGAYMPRLRRETKIKIRIVLIVVIILAIFVPVSLFLRDISSSMALSDANDLITATINDTINRKLDSGNYGYDYFVTLEKDSEGNITAITTNMSRINSFSSEILREIIDAGDSGDLKVKVPLGNLLGLNTLLGKGPEIPIDIIMLTSSFVDFKNELSSAGINQTKHQIILEVVVDIDILIPWGKLSTEVVSEVLIAETVIVGRVPDTYVNVE